MAHPATSFPREMVMIWCTSVGPQPVNPQSPANVSWHFDGNFRNNSGVNDGPSWPSNDDNYNSFLVPTVANLWIMSVWTTVQVFFFFFSISSILIWQGFCTRRKWQRNYLLHGAQRKSLPVQKHVLTCKGKHDTKPTATSWHCWVEYHWQIWPTQNAPSKPLLQIF